jgi:hypothetical protein
MICSLLLHSLNPVTIILNTLSVTEIFHSSIHYVTYENLHARTKEQTHFDFVLNFCNPEDGTLHNNVCDKVKSYIL